MKKITLLFMLLGVMAFSQSNVTSILNEQCAFSGGCDVFSLGCCLEDDIPELPETNTDLCVWTEYYVTEDVYYNRDTFTLSNAILVFQNGANFYINETQIVTTCNAQIVFEGGGDYIQWEPDTLSVFDPKYSLQYPDNTPYIVYNNLGQIVKKGVLRRNVALKFDLPKGIYYIRPKNYEATKFIIPD